MRLRCDSTHAGHACSLVLDWLGHHPGDHAAHDGHDVSRAVLATWPSDGKASRGIPVQAAPGGSGPAASGAARPSAGSGGAAAPARARQRSARREPYAYEISDWDLLPDA